MSRSGQHDVRYERHPNHSLEQLVTIELFGQPYTFKAESETDTAQRVAEALVREVAKIESQHADQTTHMTKLSIMILAALNIASENQELKRKFSNLIGNVSQRSTRLIGLLDAGLHRHSAASPVDASG